MATVSRCRAATVGRWEAVARTSAPAPSTSAQATTNCFVGSGQPSVSPRGIRSITDRSQDSRSGNCISIRLPVVKPTGR